ncbi:MAG TPA: hypothetical protein VGQ82_10225 [Chthoniobacterales bacterium]|nr:hypothetical protein [Chthoniobacterales bacterium]
MRISSSVGLVVFFALAEREIVLPPRDCAPVTRFPAVLFRFVDSVGAAAVKSSTFAAAAGDPGGARRVVVVEIFFVTSKIG